MSRCRSSQSLLGYWDTPLSSKLEIPHVKGWTGKNWLVVVIWLRSYVAHIIFVFIILGLLKFGGWTSSLFASLKIILFERTS